MRVDDPMNGAWLPGYEKDLPHWAMPDSVAHAWLNHAGYHPDRIGRSLMRTQDDSLQSVLIAKLQKAAFMLQREKQNIPRSAIRTKKDTERLRNNKA